jgi:hypothetical protein
MLLRIAGISVLCTLAVAQSDHVSRVRPVASPPRDAGIYHVATGTWTRNASMASLGPDRIYVNTCPSGYYFALSGDTFIDEGRLPSPSSPYNLSSRPGCATSYDIEGFELAYCTDTPNITWSCSFLPTYVPCESATGLTPAATFNLSGLPSTSTLGVSMCWVVQIDVAGPPPTATLFTMQADGDGQFNTPPDTFGWSIRCDLVGAAGTRTGPLFAGDPNNCTSYDGTRWDNGPAPAWPNNLTEHGTGMGTADQFRIENGPTTPGCYFFGVGPWYFMSFHLVLFSDACSAIPVGLPFCFGDGTATACPCGNAGGAGRGCAGSVNPLGALLGASGTASLSTDTLLLRGSDMPNATCLYFQGTSQENGGSGSVFGDGLRCAGGLVTRLGIKLNVANGSSYPGATDPPIHVQGNVTQPGMRTYQVWYRNAAAFCTPATFNLSNGILIAWGA